MTMNTLAQPPVIIVGGGLSGLSAAAILARAGHAVTLFEKASAPGGRAMTKYHGEFSFNLGAHAFYLDGSGEELLNELGVRYSGSSPDTDEFLALDGGKIHLLLTGMAEISEVLSVAFLHLLEHLSPIERAVFLLRQVFDYEYAEIAAIVQKSEDNCRQIVRRARQHLSARRPLFHASKQQQDDILHQFVRACTSGDMDGLLSLLANDIVAYSDSGGKVPAARNPIYGSDKVARFLLGTLRKVSDGYSFRIGSINGQPGIINYINGVPHSIVTLDVVDRRIREIDMVANPDKLRGVPVLS